MLANTLLVVTSTVVGSLMAVGNSHNVRAHMPKAPRICTDMCAATATVLALPPGSCGQSMPSYRVDWGNSTSGQCDDCFVLGHCNNTAKIIITPAAGTYLNGGGFTCDGQGGSVTATITTCGQSAVSQIHIHSTTPCTDANSLCTVYATIGCKNC